MRLSESGTLGAYHHPNSRCKSKADKAEDEVDDGGVLLMLAPGLTATPSHACHFCVSLFRCSSLRISKALSHQLQHIRCAFQGVGNPRYSSVESQETSDGHVPSTLLMFGVNSSCAKGEEAHQAAVNDSLTWRISTRRPWQC
jgi:hypothetical protein